MNFKLIQKRVMVTLATLILAYPTQTLAKISELSTQSQEFTI